MVLAQHTPRSAVVLGAVPAPAVRFRPVRVAEVVLDVPRRSQRAAETVAYALGAQGLELRDADAGRVQVVLWLPSSVTKRSVETAASGVRGLRVGVRRIEASWWTPPPPRPVGARFVIVADAAARSPGRMPIRLDSALTFGDGQHATTTLCVSSLEEVIARRRPSSLLDVGTGTGVLAIVAGKLGVDDIVATDVDPLAREAARRALRVNAVHARVQTALPRRAFDCVVANLYFEPLVAMAGELAARVDDEGTLIVSGFTRGDDVAAAFGRNSLVVRRRSARDGWCCFELTRPQRSHSARRRRR